MKSITPEQGYTAMFRFLDQLFDSTDTYDIGGLLGDMRVLPEGYPADSAMRKRWVEAVEYALKDTGVTIKLDDIPKGSGSKGS